MCNACRARRLSNMSKRPIRPVERQRMRPWLENLLNKKVVEGLKWRDMEENIFEVPWRHGSRHGYNANKDADLFERWAKHTGRYEEENPNPKKWKANFRCALNSLEDVKEIVASKTNQTKSVRVYQFVEVKIKKEGRRPYKRKKLSFECEESNSSYNESNSSSKYSELNSVSKYNVDRVELSKNTQLSSDSIVKYESEKVKPDIYGTEISTSTPNYCGDKTDSSDIHDLLSQFALPDSTSDLNHIKKETGCKEEPVQVIEIQLPYKSNCIESFEIERGVLPEHMSGFVMIINAKCDITDATDENGVSSRANTSCSEIYLKDVTTISYAGVDELLTNREDEISDEDSNVSDSQQYSSS